MKANNLLLIILVFILEAKIFTECFIFRGEVANILENRYVAQIFNYGKSCGGSIISGEHILTAAHCFSHNKDVQFIFVEAKNINEMITSNVKKLAVHPEFSESNDYINDIAIVQIHVNLLEYPMFEALPLWTQNVPNVEVMGKISGYGLTEKGSVSRELMTTYVEVIDPKLCKIVHKDRQFCAGDLTGAHDGCDGDSGLTFIVNKTAVGVLSIGTDCFDETLKIKLSRYTFVTFYTIWIKQTILEQTTS